MFNKSNKFFYGVDLQKSPYFIANIYENKFDYCHDLKKAFCANRSNNYCTS